MGHLEGGEDDYGLNLDHYRSDFTPQSSAAVMDELTPRVRSMLSMPLYYGLMENHRARLDALVEELTALAAYAEQLVFDPRDSFMILEDLAAHIDRLDREASMISIPNDLEDRASDDTVLLRNPIMLSRL